MEKARITGILFVFIKKYLGKDSQEKIWEVMSNMDIIKEKMNDIIKEKVEQRDKQLISELLVESIQAELPQQYIDGLIKRGKFSQEEVEEIYKEVNHSE